jgi:hypothetical protein
METVMEDALVKERIKKMHIDYPAATGRLLNALAFIARKLPNHPVPASQLCMHVFDKAARETWSHETRRRRVRDAVVFARRQLADFSALDFSDGKRTLAGNGQGYWLSADANVIRWYADRRRKRALHELAAMAKLFEVL